MRFSIVQQQVKMFCVLALLSSLMMSCLNESAQTNLEEPAFRIELNKKLNEISGLTWVSDSVLACIQDEKALVYYINSETGKIIDSFDFGQDGDFEGLAVQGNNTYILRSDGQILISKKEKKAKAYKFKNGNDFDFEGLCVDDENNRLLVACKQHKQKKKDKDVYVYGFSLKKKKYLKTPVFVFSKKDLGENFRPSGIAIHPNKNIYILSSLSKSLAIISPKGKVLQIYKLNTQIYHQPEGICFSPNGQLFISNEKNEFYPSLLKFQYEK